jgi:hypothetical protein
MWLTFPAVARSRTSGGVRDLAVPVDAVQVGRPVRAGGVWTWVPLSTGTVGPGRKPSPHLHADPPALGPSSRRRLGSERQVLRVRRLTARRRLRGLVVRFFTESVVLTQLTNDLRRRHLDHHAGVLDSASGPRVLHRRKDLSAAG